MNYKLLILFDYSFLVFHSLLIVFNLVGWVWKKTRKLHLVSMIITFGSWFIGGIWFGWGYCFMTDWHWQVREQMGHPIVNDSYTGFLIKELFGIKNLPENLDLSIMLMFFVAFLLAIFFFASDVMLKKKIRKIKNNQ